MPRIIDTTYTEETNILESLGTELSTKAEILKQKERGLERYAEDSPEYFKAVNNYNLFRDEVTKVSDKYNKKLNFINTYGDTLQYNENKGKNYFDKSGEVFTKMSQDLSVGLTETSAGVRGSYETLANVFDSEGFAGGLEALTFGRDDFRKKIQAGEKERFVNRQKGIDEAFGDFGDRGGSGIGQVLANNPGAIALATPIAPVIETGLTAVGLDDDAQVFFAKGSEGTGEAGEALGINLTEGGKQAWFENGLAILTLGVGAGLSKGFKSVTKSSKGIIKSLKYIDGKTISAAGKTNEIMNSLKTVGTIDGLRNSVNFTPKELQLHGQLVEGIKKVQAKKGEVTATDVKSISQRLGIPDLDSGVFPGEKAVDGEYLNRVIRAQSGDKALADIPNFKEIELSNIRAQDEANLTKALKSGDPEDLNVALKELSGERLPIDSNLELKAKQKTIDKLTKQLVEDAGLTSKDKNKLISKLHRELNRAIIQEDLISKKTGKSLNLLLGRTSTVEDLISVASDVKQAMRFKNKIGKLYKMPVLDSLEAFTKNMKKEFDKGFKIAEALGQSQLRKGIKSFRINEKVKVELIKNIEQFGKDAGLGKLEINKIKGRLAKGILEKSSVKGINRKEYLDFINSAKRDIHKELIDKEVVAISDSIKRFKLINKTNKGLAGDKGVKLIADLDIARRRWDLAKKDVINNPEEVLRLQQVFESALRKVESFKRKGGTTTYINGAQASKLSFLTEKYRILKKGGEGNLNDLRELKKQIEDLHTETRLELAQKQIKRELGFNQDLIDIESDGIIPKRSTDDIFEGDLLANGEYVQYAKGVIEAGKNISTRYLSFTDRYIASLSNKAYDSTLFKVLRTNISDAHDNVVTQTKLHIAPVEEAFTKASRGYKGGQKGLNRDLLVYAYIKQGLWNDLIRSGLTREIQKGIINRVEASDLALAAYNQGRTMFENTYNQVRKTSLEVDNIDLGKVENYFPIIRKGVLKEGEDILSSSFSKDGQVGQISFTEYYKATTKDGFTKERVLSNKKIDLNRGFMDVAQEHGYNQIYFAQMKEAGTYARRIVNKLGVKKLGQQGYEDLNKYVDKVLSDGRSSKPNWRGFNSILSWSNAIVGNMTGVYLGLNAGTIVKQYGALPDSIGYVGGSNLLAGAGATTKNMFSKKWLNEVFENSPQLADRLGGDGTIREITQSNSLLAKTQRAALTPMIMADTHNSLMVFLAGVSKKAKELGVKVDLDQPSTFTREMVEEGELSVRLGVGSARMIDLPPILQNPIAKVMLPFHTSVLNRWGILLQDTVNAKTKFQMATLITGWLTSSILDKAVTAARASARTKDEDDFEIFEMIIAPEAYLLGPSKDKAIGFNEALFGKDWKRYGPEEKLALLLKAIIVTETPGVSHFASAAQYDSPLIGTEGHVLATYEHLVKAVNADTITEAVLNLGALTPGAAQFAKQELKNLKVEKKEAERRRKEREKKKKKRPRKRGGTVILK